MTNAGVPRVEIVAVGDELVHGRTVDTNSSWLATELERIGLSAARFTTVGDAPGELRSALAGACQRAELVVCTGGLGPTEDDRTRHAAAEAAGVGLEFHEPSWEHVQSWFAHRNRVVSESNRRQALLPQGASALSNDRGTAPGFRLEIEDAPLFALPGVPGEMRAMAAAHVFPAAKERFAGRLRPVGHATVWALGPTEAGLGEQLADRMAPGGDIEVGITAKDGLLAVRVVTRDVDEHSAHARADGVAREIAALIGDEVLHIGEEDPAETLIRKLSERSLTIATAESCTGGLIAAALTDIPGSSAAFPGGFVVYANERKIEALGVPDALIEEHGAVSEQVAEAMARGARDQVGADFAIAVSGVAGPGGGSEEKPVGFVCFGLASPTGSRAWTRRFPALGREFVRRRAVWEALAEALRTLDAESSKDA